MLFTSSLRHTFVLVLVLMLQAGSPSARAEPLWRGGDVSFLPQVEAAGGTFQAHGETAGLLDILSVHGLDTVRLRLWHSPQGGHSGLPEVLALARRAEQAHLRILLDFHYSDTWADPAHQHKPAAWQGLAYPVLCDSVRAYTADVLRAFAAQGTPPAMVQLGNEITTGLLWDDGRVGGVHDTPEQWDRLAGLLSAAAGAVAEAVPAQVRPDIMIHLDRGGDNAGCRWFLDNILERGVAFDAIGLSYYPWWHGDLAALAGNLNDLAGRYGKDVMVVETAYPWTLGWHDGVHNMVGTADQLLPGYADTPHGQARFLAALLQVVLEVPEGRGKGVVWWSPGWISSPGAGSAWENLTLFDFQGNALPALQTLGRGRGRPEPDPRARKIRRP